ncbi:YncE family protein [Methanosarcina barkeri]|uniref:YncE family protein n=1 Tax=Methanosarcina barkeri TaxID=2208 RepID=UPI0006D11C2B|nr:YncE family protein [Methanosarcina barkeri]
MIQQKNKVTDTINIGHYDSLGDIAVTPDGKRVYVLAEGGPTSVIDTATNTIIATVNVGSYPGGIVITPDGKKAYVANGYNNVSVIDTATNIVVATVSDRIGSVSGIAVAPNGSKVYVANYGYGANNIYDGGGNISVIDTLTNKVTVMVPLGKYTYGVAITPDGTKLYVANDYSNVSVIDTSTNKVTSTVNIGTRHLGIAIGNKKSTKCFSYNSL